MFKVRIVLYDYFHLNYNYLCLMVKKFYVALSSEMH